MAEGRKPQVLGPPGQRVRDPRSREDVRGARQQELPGSRIAIDADLDRQQQIGDALDLVEHHRDRQPRYKTSGVAGRSVSRRLIVKRQDRCRPVARGDPLDQRALPDLTRTEDDHDTRVRERFENARPEPAIDHRHERSTLETRQICGAHIGKSTDYITADQRPALDRVHSRQPRGRG